MCSLHAHNESPVARSIPTIHQGRMKTEIISIEITSIYHHIYQQIVNYRNLVDIEIKFTYHDVTLSTELMRK